MTETKLQQKFGERLKKKYKRVYYYKIPDFKGGGMSPFDSVACVWGIFFALEFKIEPNTATKYQKAQLNLVEHAEGYALVVTNINWKACLENIGILAKAKLERR